MSREVQFAKFLGMIPVLSTPGGRCLTTANWQESGVERVSVYLSELLMKPGLDFLKTLSNLATYVGWNGPLVLNATLSALDQNERYALRSHYDGRRIDVSVEDILTVITTLQPSIAILPQGALDQHIGLCRSLPEDIFIYIPAVDLEKVTTLERPYGVYLAYDPQIMSQELLIQQLEQYKDLSCYVAGDLSVTLMSALIEHGASFIETDMPSSDACSGKVYSDQGDISLIEAQFETQFTTIDESCHCPVCKQGFTRAYLHHLFQQTPLLCQRLLVQHNVFYCQSRVHICQHTLDCINN